MKALRTMAAPRDFPMVGDSKLVSYPNLLALREAEVNFVAPAPAARIPDDLYAARDTAKARLVDFTVICLALLVFCLIERQVRHTLGGDQTMRGLYPDNRAVRPTGRMIFYHLAGLRIR